MDESQSEVYTAQTESKTLDEKEETICEMCNITSAKYTCPACFLRSCSLQCSKDHKAKFTCTGVRSKTHFIAKEDYNENTMMSGKSSSYKVWLPAHLSQITVFWKRFIACPITVSERT
jgi:hypothetical protein